MDPFSLPGETKPDWLKDVGKLIGERLAGGDIQEGYRADPTRWANDKLGIELWSMQQTIIESVRDNPKTAVHTCHQVGKSLCAAVAACWFIDVHPPGTAFVLSSAPTNPQITAILWREMNRLHTKGKLPGRMNLKDWYIGNELVAFGRKPSDYNPDAFQGVHSEHILVVLDEGSGIPKTIWDAASTLTANEGSRTLVIGNPDDPHGEFAEACKPDSGYHIIGIGYNETPNFTGEKVSNKVSSSLIAPAWVEDRRKKWGEDSALFQAKVLGKFPTDSTDGIITNSDLQSCRYLQLQPEGTKCAGLDVGGGGDRTVLRERIGPKVGREKVWLESDPMAVCGEIALTLSEWETQRVVVDVIGIGWGLAGRLRELSSQHTIQGETSHSAEVVKFNAAQTSNEPVRFHNKRAELHWMGRELSRLHQWDLENVDDDTIAELAEPKYEIMDSKGKVKVESKDQIKKRLGGKSPDKGDALLMAFWEGDTFTISMPVKATDLLNASYTGDRQDIEQRTGKPKRPQPVTDNVKDQKRKERQLARELMLGR